MMSMASDKRSCRSARPGQPAPMMCSFSRSPAPSPRVKRLLLSNPRVAAHWATIAGWYRMIGQVTAVINPMRRVALAIAPSTGQAKGA